MRRTLVAGVGNIFFADDGFGPEVARRLAALALPDGVSVSDFGIRGLHLAYELTSGGYDEAIVIDAVARGGAPGTLYVIEPDLGGVAGSGTADAHGVDLGAVFAMVQTLGKPPARVWVVGCETSELTERIGLSDPVQHSVQQAVAIVENMLTSSAASGAVQEVER